jgi:predicted peptidase
MPYRLMQPLHFDGNQRYPVLISLHGAGGHGTFLWTQHDPDYFAAAAPCAGTGRTGRPEFVQP